MKQFTILILALFAFTACAKKEGDQPEALQIVVEPKIEKSKNHKTICLNMIVKNETSVIRRCLASVLPIIDTWVIVDTGSTDGTQKMICDFMKENGVPGQLYERQWVNFEHNRNEALELAQGKADFVFFIDADEYLVYEPNFKLPDFSKDYYYMTIDCGGSKFGKIQLINNHMDWKWVGVLHEVICPPASRSFATLENVVNIYTTEGARSKDPQKFQKDAKVLEEALKKDPDNARYVFYLAQSYACAENYPAALKNYKKRVAMGGWEQEVFWAMLQVATLQEQLGEPEERFIDSYKRAFQYRTSRIEPIYHLANYYRREGNYRLGYDTAKIGLTMPVSNDVLFVERWIYDYGMLLEFSICAYWIGQYQESQKACLQLLERKGLPDNIRECAEKNLGFANAKLLENICYLPVD